MTRTQALTVIVFPLAIAMAADAAAVRAQEVTAQPMVSRSGVDLASMDPTANPCNDFYQYACGGWIKNHPAPPDQPCYGRFEELQDRNNGILRDILEQAGKPGRFRANGVVSNMPEFAKALSCEANAPMIGQPVCRVW
jgi:predicted metalloendopeptidase